MTNQLALLISSVALTKQTIRLLEEADSDYVDQDYLGTLRDEYDEHVQTLLDYCQVLINEERKAGGLPALPFDSLVSGP
ncbi:hypothetical protein [Rathayibacter sp. AY1B5]|uniref:hypothetical protein n=1 Tax=Rathayibacter sp. AY1B5 TaxID=2080530 RepID=UPI000CE7DAA5|nr:hypothetical protein [Rathayibacter sp. AY1B5]PPI28196.1 hypothetical protein C5D44_00205 [Rathayibacter sp. AY1B5]